MRFWPSIFFIATMYVFPGTPPLAGAAELGVLAKTEIVAYLDSDQPHRAELVAELNEFSKSCPFAEIRFVDSLEEPHSYRAVLGDRHRLYAHLSAGQSAMMESRYQPNTPALLYRSNIQNLVAVVGPEERNAGQRHNGYTYARLDSIRHAARFVVAELCLSSPGAIALKDARLPFEVVASQEMFRAHERDLEHERQLIELQRESNELARQVNDNEHILAEYDALENKIKLHISLHPSLPSSPDYKRTRSALRAIDELRETLNRTPKGSSEAAFESEVENTEFKPNQIRVDVLAGQNSRGVVPIQLTLRRLSGGKVVDETILHEPVDMKYFILDQALLEMVRLQVLSSMSNDQLAQLYLSTPKQPLDPE